ncbi:MAG TPA: molybdopterin synthase sulfur carrier subunit [Acidimicrobiaceae bacterium]|nr:molybdopterin synthase sulfur carrier subunit [Acidimicrobiaceae bacterium]HAQ24133.1 molybdopterin synthase sulfur carrier subunit [Acidimicrobiaceae bacterium]HCV33675.1 molybdopterin synthase sulfur carrier subunit [Acidimicrobiaceae bacterium]|tara:strand:+ start:141 stop:419 length:279 start_codon:yes stop_codon:yes gene_type:complete
MAVTVRIPTTLRPLTTGQAEVEVEASTVREALSALDAAHPGFSERITDESGILRRFVNVFVDDEDVRFMDGLDSSVLDGATVSIVPAVAGGR